MGSINVTQGVLPASSQWRAVAYNGTVFCAVATNTDQCATAPDGVTWTARTMSSTSFWNDMTAKGTRFCAVADLGVAAVSDDGISWTPDVNFPSLNGPVVGNNGTIFCAVGSNGVSTSADGITWTATTPPPVVGIIWEQLTWSNGFFLVVGANGSGTNNYVARSADGITWTSELIVGSFASSVAGNGSGLVLAGSESSIKVNRSTDDGDTFTDNDLPAIGAARRMFSDGVGFFSLSTSAVSTGSVSLDGIVWESYPVPTESWSRMAFGAGVYVAAAFGDTVSIAVEAEYPVPTPFWTNRIKTQEVI